MNATSQTTTELSADDMDSLQTGDVISVSYVPRQGSNEKSFEAEVTDTDLTRMDAGEHGMVLIGEVTLCRTVTDKTGDEKANDDFPRRRLTATAGSLTLKSRSTTRNGAVWSKMSDHGSVTVTQTEEPEPEPEDDEDNDEDPEVGDTDDSGTRPADGSIGAELDETVAELDGTEGDTEDAGSRDAFSSCLNCSAETDDTFCEDCSPDTDDATDDDVAQAVAAVEDEETEDEPVVMADGGTCPRGTDLHGAEGEVIRADCRIFHRAGMDGAHHVEEDVRFILDEGRPASQYPEEATLLLHPDELDRLYESYTSLLDGLTVPRDDAEAHPQIVSLEVRG